MSVQKKLYSQLFWATGPMERGMVLFFSVFLLLLSSAHAVAELGSNRCADLRESTGTRAAHT